LATGKLETSLKSDSQIGDERQVVRRDEGFAVAWQLDRVPLHVSLVGDVVEVDDREDTWIGAPALEVRLDVDALEQRAQRPGRETTHPFVEVAEDDLGSANTVIVHVGGESRGLIAPLEDCGPEVH